MLALQVTDPLNTPASAEEVRTAMIEFIQAPITTDDGNVFLTDRDSLELLDGAIRALGPSGTIDYPIVSGLISGATGAQLQAYKDEVTSKRDARGLQIQAQLASMSNTTKRELKNLRDQYFGVLNA